MYLPTICLFLYCTFVVYSVFLIDRYYQLTFGVANLLFFFFFTTAESVPSKLLWIHRFSIWNSVSEYIAFLLWCFFNFVPTVHTKISFIMEYLCIVITRTAFTIHIITHSQKENYPFYVKILTWPCYFKNFISSPPLDLVDNS